MDDWGVPETVSNKRPSTRQETGQRKGSRGCVILVGRESSHRGKMWAGRKGKTKEKCQRGRSAPHYLFEDGLIGHRVQPGSPTQPWPSNINGGLSPRRRNALRSACGSSSIPQQVRWISCTSSLGARTEGVKSSAA